MKYTSKKYKTPTFPSLSAEFIFMHILTVKLAKKVSNVSLGFCWKKKKETLFSVFVGVAISFYMFRYTENT